MRNKNGKKRTNQMPSLELNNITYTLIEERANLFGGLLEQTFKDSNNDKFDKKFEIRIKNKVDEYKTKLIQVLRNLRLMK
jgi:hypothetical protein